MKLLTLLLGLLLAQSSAAETSLSGRVETLGSHAPVPTPRWCWRPWAEAWKTYQTTIADAAGHFVFRNVRPGSFRVHAERQGYLRGEAGSRTAGIVGSPVAVVQGQTPQTVVVTLTPTGVIAGRILSEDGPVRGALVRALRVVFRDGERNTEMAAAARADDRGEYRLFGLPPGYLVDAVRPPRARIEGNEYVVPLIASNANGNRREMRVPLAQALADGAVDPAAYESGTRLPSLYPGTMDEEAAIPIDIAAGAAVPGVDIVIVPVPSVTVRGRVIAGGAGMLTESVGIGVRRLRRLVVRLAWQSARHSGPPGGERHLRAAVRSVRSIRVDCTNGRKLRPAVRSDRRRGG